MNVSSRGPNNTVVLDRSGVPINAVCDAIAEHKNIDWIKQRYPVTTDEIYLCVETFVDITRPNKKDSLQLRVIPSDNPARNFDLETTLITDRVFFSILTYARGVMPMCDSVQDLYRYGIEIILNEALTDIKDGNYSFENSDIHSIVFDAFASVYDNVHENIDVLLAQFDIDAELAEVLKNGRN